MAKSLRQTTGQHLLRIFFALAAVLIGFGFKAGKLDAEKIWAIRGYEGETFGLTLDLAIDEDKNLYVLDSEKGCVAKFDKQGKSLVKIGVPELGRGAKQERQEMRSRLVKEGITGEFEDNNLYLPKKLFYKNQRLYILDVSKIVVYSTDNEYMGTIPLGNIRARCVFINNDDEIVVGGKADNSDSENVLHVLDLKGRIVRSFGSYFEIPSKIKYRLPSGADWQSLSLPAAFFYSGERDEYYLLSPLNREITVYDDEKAIRSIALDRPMGGGVVGGTGCGKPGSYAGYGRAHLDILTILARADRILVFRSVAVEPGSQNGMTGSSVQYFVDVFKDYRYQYSKQLGINGLPKIMDDEGCVYLINENKIPLSVEKIRLDLD